MGMDVKITDNSQKFLEALPAKMERALTAVGIVAEGYAKKDCPVDTGRLRNSITHAVQMSENAVYIGSNVNYAAFVELGTSRMKARPYLKPAAQNHSGEYKKIIQDALKSG